MGIQKSKFTRRDARSTVLFPRPPPSLFPPSSPVPPPAPVPHPSPVPLLPRSGSHVDSVDITEQVDKNCNIKNPSYRSPLDSQPAPISIGKILDQPLLTQTIETI